MEYDLNETMVCPKCGFVFFRWRFYRCTKCGAGH